MAPRRRPRTDRHRACRDRVARDEADLEVRGARLLGSRSWRGNHWPCARYGCRGRAVRQEGLAQAEGLQQSSADEVAERGAGRPLRDHAGQDVVDVGVVVASWHRQLVARLQRPTAQFPWSTASPVAASRPLLVSASPAGPGQDLLGVGRSRPHEAPQQPAHFRHGEGQEIGREVEARLSPRWPPGAGRRGRRAPAWRR